MIAPDVKQSETIGLLFQEPLKEMRALEFQYVYEKDGIRKQDIFEVKIRRAEALIKKSAEPLLDLTIHSHGNQVGKIRGIFFLSKEGKREFISMDVKNQAMHEGGIIHPYEKPLYIPSIVRETIAQLLIHQIIQVWRSSQFLNAGSQRMYEALCNDARLNGKLQQNSEGQLEYVLEKSN